MPQGQLFFKTKNTSKQWVDAYTEYGMSLEDGAIGEIITPAPMKEGVSNSLATADGVAYMAGTIGKKNERTLSFNVHILAATEAAGWTAYRKFCREVLDPQYVQMKIVDGTEPFPTYLNNGVETAGALHLLFRSCHQVGRYRMRLLKWELTFAEPNPSVRDNREPSIMN